MRALAAAALLAPQAGASQTAATPPAVPASTASALIPIEHFATLPMFESPVLSPDGRRVAARITTGDVSRIGIFNVGGTAEQIRYVPAPSSASFRWAGDDRLLIDVNSMIILVGYTILPVPVRRVVSHDLATGKATSLGSGAGFRDEIVFVDPAGRYVLLSTQSSFTATPSVRHVDLVNGNSVEVQRAQRGVWNWFADAEGVVRVGVDYGERRTKLYYRPTRDAPMRLVESRRTVRDDSVYEFVRFVGNTERGIVVTNAETGRFAVYEYDFSTDTRGATLFEHPDVDVTAPILGRDGRLDGVAYEDERPRTHWINPDMAAIQASLDRTFPGKTNTIVNGSRDGNRMLVWSAAADDPGTYYVYDRAARRMEIFASPFDGLHEISFAPVRPISYQSRDGLRINGYLTLPRGSAGRNLPLVVLPHGGPFLRDSWVFDQDVQFLASRGYAVLQPNFRGSTGYGRDFVARGYGQLGGGMIDDMEDGIDWLAREGIADARRVCIVGTSYGGYAAAWAAIRSPERYRCAVSFAGPSDLRSMVRYDTATFLPRRYERDFRRRIEGEEQTDLDAISPLRQAARLRIPLLIGHGVNDRTVPTDQSSRLVTALTRRGAPPEFVFYPKAAHGFSNSSERLDWYRRVETFLAQHNPAGAAPAAAATPAAP